MLKLIICEKPRNYFNYTYNYPFSYTSTLLPLYKHWSVSVAVAALYEQSHTTLVKMVQHLWADHFVCYAYHYKYFIFMSWKRQNYFPRLVRRWSLRFPNSCSPVASHVLLWVWSDGPVGKPLATGCLSRSFSTTTSPLSFLLQGHTLTRAHYVRILTCTVAFRGLLAAVRAVLFWPAPTRQTESINLYSPGRRAISERLYWASCLKLTLKDSHWEGNWRAERAEPVHWLLMPEIQTYATFQFLCSLYTVTWKYGGTLRILLIFL